MVNVQIPEELDVVLQSAAERAGRTRDEFAQDILTAHLEDESLPLSAFSDAQLERLKHSIEQVKRGEVIGSEQVDQMFADWLREIKTR